MNHPSHFPTPSGAGPAPDRILAIKEVVALTSLSRSTIYRGIEDGEFPAPIQISKHRVGWPASVIERWLREREQAGTAPPRPPRRRRRK